MRVENVMKTKLVTIAPTLSIREALKLCKEKRIRHLPVLEKDDLVGLVSDRDLRNALPSSLSEHEDENLLLQQPVSKIMTTNVITIHPLDSVEEAAFSLYASRIGCLPVMTQQKLVGIITETDILHALVEVMGVHQPSSLITVEVNDFPGQLAEVAQLFKESQVNITNVISYPSKNKGKKYLRFRVKTMDPRMVINLLEENQYQIVWPDQYWE